MVALQLLDAVGPWDGNGLNYCQHSGIVIVAAHVLLTLLFGGVGVASVQLVCTSPSSPLVALFPLLFKVDPFMMEVCPLATASRPFLET